MKPFVECAYLLAACAVLAAAKIVAARQAVFSLWIDAADDALTFIQLAPVALWAIWSDRPPLTRGIMTGVAGALSLLTFAVSSKPWLPVASGWFETMAWPGVMVAVCASGAKSIGERLGRQAKGAVPAQGRWWAAIVPRFSLRGMMLAMTICCFFAYVLGQGTIFTTALWYNCMLGTMTGLWSVAIAYIVVGRASQQKRVIAGWICFPTVVAMLAAGTLWIVGHFSLDPDGVFCVGFCVVQGIVLGGSLAVLRRIGVQIWWEQSLPAAAEVSDNVARGPVESASEESTPPGVRI